MGMKTKEVFVKGVAIGGGASVYAEKEGFFHKLKGNKESLEVYTSPDNVQDRLSVQKVVSYEEMDESDE